MAKIIRDTELEEDPYEQDRKKRWIFLIMGLGLIGVSVFYVIKVPAEKSLSMIMVSSCLLVSVISAIPMLLAAKLLSAPAPTFWNAVMASTVSWFGIMIFRAPLSRVLDRGTPAA